MYFKQRGPEIVILLCGGDKNNTDCGYRASQAAGSGMELLMKKATFTVFDAADYLKSEQDIAAYLAAASEDSDPQVLVAAMGDVVRARNLSKVAKDAGMTREGVYKAFSIDGNPSFATVIKVARALDLDVAFHARKSKARAGKSGKTVASTKRRQASRPSGRLAKS